MFFKFSQFKKKNLFLIHFDQIKEKERAYNNPNSAT